ncbi:MAG: ASCH domain-containing protein [Planctomycetes bacterium]|nr:ASCH domain-containing protein [Planctomycetota bacterium]
MRALTLRQPWAWAIIHAGKNVENRSWNTRIRGTVAIHAGMGLDGLEYLPRGVPRPRAGDLVRGALVGLVDIVDVVERSRSKWFFGPYGFVLRNPRPLWKPIPCKGKLGFWKVPPRIVRAIEAQGVRGTP